MSWYVGDMGYDEVAEYAIQQVKRLRMKEVNALLWICCMLPEGSKWLVDRSGIMFKRFPQFMDWEHFALTCPDRTVRRRVRAYPSGIDWGEGVEPPDDFPPLPSKPGIDYRIAGDANSRLTLSIVWDPLIVTSRKEVTEAVEFLQQYFEVVHKPCMAGKVPGILERLAQQRSKGGRPRWGVIQDEMARECARLTDEEGFRATEIADKFGFGKQFDSYGNLSQSSTVRDYVKRGRKLRME